MWRDRLGALAVERDLAPDAAPRLARLLELLRDDPTAPTTVTDPSKGVETHIADSLSALELPEVRAAHRIADLGSGAGLPGLALAVALPHAGMWLVESQRRKCAFLERAREVVAADNAGVACARAEEWPERELDVVCARAVAPLAVLAEYAAPLLRIGGVLVAWKGVRDDAEEDQGRAAAVLLGLGEPRVVPMSAVAGADHRNLHVYSKVRDTPRQFPRRPGMARKRPLSG